MIEETAGLYHYEKKIIQNINSSLKLKKLLSKQTFFPNVPSVLSFRAISKATLIAKNLVASCQWIWGCKNSKLPSNIITRAEMVMTRTRLLSSINFNKVLKSSWTNPRRGMTPGSRLWQLQRLKHHSASGHTCYSLASGDDSYNNLRTESARKRQNWKTVGVFHSAHTATVIPVGPEGIRKVLISNRGQQTMETVADRSWATTTTSIRNPGQ